MTTSPAPPLPPVTGLLWLIWLTALLTSAGSLILSLGLGLQPCPLCYYQRTFAFAAWAVLTLGLFTRAGRAAPLGLLTLPLVVAGTGVAGVHVFLERTGRLECPAGVFGLGSAPAQSLVAFGILFVLTALEVQRRQGPDTYSAGASVNASLVGLALLVACLAGTPPPATRDRPYDSEKEPLLQCRPPYRAALEK